MADPSHLNRVWDIIERVGVCMLTTQSEAGLRARPVAARPDRAAGVIWFITDWRSGKEHEIEAEHDVGLVFIDADDKAYLSLIARGEPRRDPAKAAEIWKATDAMWWNGPDVGWAGEQDGRGVRIRQVAIDRRETQSRRKPQGHRPNVTSIAARERSFG
jgi:general stress protein 26